MEVKEYLNLNIFWFLPNNEIWLVIANVGAFGDKEDDAGS